MAWLSVAIALAGRHAHALSEALLGHGALSVAIEDAGAGGHEACEFFAQPDTAELAVWPQCLIVALFDPLVEIDAVMSAALTAIGLGETTSYRVRKIEDRDWVRLSQSQFEPIRISQRLWIVPTWRDPPDPGAINIRLNPGQAFGTGTHPTTRLCLDWLAEHIRGGESVLDYGCGSGILGIAAAKLGAKTVTGIDVDPVAIAAAQENAALNGVRATFDLPSVVTRTVADVALANILAAPLQMLAPLLTEATTPGGTIVLSGILRLQAIEVIAAYRPHFGLSVHGEAGEWVCLAGRKQ